MSVRENYTDISSSCGTMADEDEPSHSAKGEENITNFEEAQKLIKQLKEKIRAQSLQFLAWHRKFKMQEELLMRVTADQNEQLHLLSTKLLLFEAKLLHKQRDIGSMLSQREHMLYKQRQIIKTLQNRLLEAGIEWSCNEIDERSTDDNNKPTNDADSAIIMEDDDNCNYYSCHYHRDNYCTSDNCDNNNKNQLRFFQNINNNIGNNDNNDDNSNRNWPDDNGNDATVMRSISDVLELPSSSKILSTRRSNGFLRRPEILETVYSVEEDGDADSLAINDHEDGRSSTSVKFNGELTNDNNSNNNNASLSSPTIRRLERLSNVIYQSTDETLSEEEEEEEAEPEQSIVNNTPPPVTAYNRVMSNNHRSVTKPKDVKYRRINKAKSKSLEELRGRLRNWVEKGNKFAFSFDHSN